LVKHASLLCQNVLSNFAQITDDNLNDVKKS
jgi:hypothetical protein